MKYRHPHILKTWLKKAAGDPLDRAMFNAIHFITHNGEKYAVTTDGFRMHIAKNPPARFRKDESYQPEHDLVCIDETENFSTIPVAMRAYIGKLIERSTSEVPLFYIPTTQLRKEIKQIWNSFDPPEDADFTVVLQREQYGKIDVFQQRKGAAIAHSSALSVGESMQFTINVATEAWRFNPFFLLDMLWIFGGTSVGFIEPIDEINPIIFTVPEMGVMSVVMPMTMGKHKPTEPEFEVETP